MTGRTVRRLVVGAVVALAAFVVTAVAGLEPDGVRVALLGVLLATGLGLVLDAVPRSGVLWYPVPTHPPLNRGSDQVTQTHLRRLEDHQLSRHPDAVVRDRLAVLADQVLQVRHAVGARSEEGRTRLGPDLDEVLHGPVVRLNPRRIDQVLRQIEEL